MAKDLISESAALFETLGMTERSQNRECTYRPAIGAKAHLMRRGLPYDSSCKISQKNRVSRNLRALLNQVVEGRRTHRLIPRLFDLSSNHSPKGKFHNLYATVLVEPSSEDYYDRALVEYAAASYHFEQAGHRRFQAR